MSISLQQTDTAAPNGSLAACSVTSNIGSTEDNRTATSGGTPGSASNSFGVSATSGTVRRAVYFETAAGELDNYTVPAGNWVIRLNITTANALLNWKSVWVCRVNSAGVSQATIGNNTGNSISLGTTGVKSLTVSGSSQTPSPGDRIYIVLGFATTDGNDDRVSYKPDQLIDTPMTVPTQPPVLPPIPFSSRQGPPILGAPWNAVLERIGLYSAQLPAGAPPPAPPGVSLRAAGTIATGNNVSSIVVQVPTVVTGDMMVLAAMCDNGALLTSNVSGWSFLQGIIFDSGELGLWVRPANLGPATYTVSVSGGPADIMAQIRTYRSGTGLTLGVDSSTSQSTPSSANDSLTGLAGNQPNEMAVAFFGWHGVVDPVAAPSGWGDPTAASFTGLAGMTLASFDKLTSSTVSPIASGQSAAPNAAVGVTIYELGQVYGNTSFPYPIVSGGPPGLHAPWSRWPAGTGDSAISRAPAGQSLPVPTISGGPPIPGAPWVQRRIPDPILASLTIAPPPQPISYAPDFTGGGPPMPGTPWGFWRLQIPLSGPAPPAAIPAQIDLPPVTGGPPIIGAPWARRFTVDPAMALLVQPTGGQGVPVPPPGQTPGGPFHFMPLVPTISSIDEESRLRAHTDLVSQILNSLILQGVLVRTGFNTWAVNRAGGFATSGTPTSANNLSNGFPTGATWLDTSSGLTYIATQSTMQSATWRQLLYADIPLNPGGGKGFPGGP